MNVTSMKLAFLIFFFVTASGVTFRRTLGSGEAGACKTDQDCQERCDAGGCKKKCLGLPSFCFKGLCACPFGTGHTSTKPIPNSTCSFDQDCSNLCPSVCNVMTCLEAKCHCGCSG